MADYKGRTRTPYTNALEAAKKIKDAIIDVHIAANEFANTLVENSVSDNPCVDIVEQPKKRGRPFKAKD